MNIFSKETYKETFRKITAKAPDYLNTNTIRNVIWFSGGIIVFIAGVIAYGVILNLREVTLAEAMYSKGFNTLSNPVIMIDRKTYRLSIYQDSILIKNYRASFGRNVNSPKGRVGDMSTPIGEYSIAFVDTSHKYHKFLMINYPNLEDAAEGLRKNIITQKEYDNLRFDFFYREYPIYKTALGNNIGIHGIGEYNDIFKNLPFVYNWTDGSIAITNESIDEIYLYVKKGTKVVIR